MASAMARGAMRAARARPRATGVAKSPWAGSLGASHWNAVGAETASATAAGNLPAATSSLMALHTAVAISCRTWLMML